MKIFKECYMKNINPKWYMSIVYNFEMIYINILTKTRIVN